MDGTDHLHGLFEDLVHLAVLPLELGLEQRDVAILLLVQRHQVRLVAVARVSPKQANGIVTAVYGRDDGNGERGGGGGGVNTVKKNKIVEQHEPGGSHQLAQERRERERR